MTANVLPGVVEQCKDCGMDDYVAKPIAIEPLSRILERWVHGVIMRPTALGTVETVAEPSS